MKVEHIHAIKARSPDALFLIHRHVTLVTRQSTQVLALHSWIAYIVGGLTAANAIFNCAMIALHPAFRKGELSPTSDPWKGVRSAEEGTVAYIRDHPELVARAATAAASASVASAVAHSREYDSYAAPSTARSRAETSASHASATSASPQAPAPRSRAATNTTVTHTLNPWSATVAPRLLHLGPCAGQSYWRSAKSAPSSRLLPIRRTSTSRRASRSTATCRAPSAR